MINLEKSPDSKTNHWKVIMVGVAVLAFFVVGDIVMIRHFLRTHARVTKPTLAPVVAHDTTAELVNKRVIDNDLQERNWGMANYTYDGGLVLPVEDLSVHTCWPWMFETLKCEVSYSLGVSGVVTTLVVDKQSSGISTSYDVLPSVQDFEMSGCKLDDTKHVMCDVSWKLWVSSSDQLLKVSSPKGVDGTIVFVGYHPEQGAFEGRVSSSGNPDITAYVLRDTFRRLAPDMVGRIPVVASSPTTANN